MLEGPCPGKTAAESSADLVDSAAVGYIAAPGQNSQFRGDSCLSRDHHIEPLEGSIPQAESILGLRKLLEDGQRQLCIHCLCLL